MIGFIKARLSERSTWLLIGAGVTAASALPEPWSYVSMAVGAIAAMINNKWLVVTQVGRHQKAQGQNSFHWGES